MVKVELSALVKKLRGVCLVMVVDVSVNLHANLLLSNMLGKVLHTNEGIRLNMFLANDQLKGAGSQAIFKRHWNSVLRKAWLVP